MGLNGPLIPLPIPKTLLKKKQIVWFGKFQIGLFDF